MVCWYFNKHLKILKKSGKEFSLVVRFSHFRNSGVEVKAAQAGS